MFTGSQNSNVLYYTGRNLERLPLSRYSERTLAPGDLYQNPVLRSNSPDPGVVRLEDRRGWALVTTTNNATVGSPVFPMYFSTGGISIINTTGCPKKKEKEGIRN